MCEIVFLLLLAKIAFAQQYSYSNDSPLPCVDKTFSIYFHIVLDSTGKDPLNSVAYQAIVDKKNKAFAPICIQFAHCQTNRIKDYSFEKIKLENKIDLMVNRWLVENRKSYSPMPYLLCLKEKELYRTQSDSKIYLNHISHCKLYHQLG